MERRRHLRFAEGGRQVGVQSLHGADDALEELRPALGDVRQRSHAGHQVGATDVGRAVELDQLLEHVACLLLELPRPRHLRIVEKSLLLSLNQLDKKQSETFRLRGTASKENSSFLDIESASA